MTSKEAISNLRWNTSMSQDCDYKENNELCDIIEKDLEVLEILKPYIRVYKDVIPNGIIYYFVNGLETDKETYEKVKEWLENEKVCKN